MNEALEQVLGLLAVLFVSYLGVWALVVVIVLAGDHPREFWLTFTCAAILRVVATRTQRVDRPRGF